MIPLKSFERAGYSDDKLRKKFLAPDKEKGIQELIDVVDSRVREGIDQTFRTAKTYKAIDEIMGRPLQQQTAALLQWLSNNKDSVVDLPLMAKSLGLENMLNVAVDNSGNVVRDKSGREIYSVDLPVFHEVLVPLAFAYTKARWASMFVDIDQDPLYSYAPAIPTDRDKIKCEIWNGITGRMTRHMGYRGDERQSLWQMLTYGHCINFPQEPWYREYVNDFGEGGGEPTKRIVKWGVRMAIPHPSKVAIDLSHRSSTINSDTGVSWGLFWDTYRWRDVARDPDIWIEDRDRYQLSGNPNGLFNSPEYHLYQMLYPCRIAFPTGVFGGGTDSREETAFAYTRDLGDKGVVICKSFHKLVPSDYGLFDYDEPAWLMFKTAFTRDVLHCQPMVYSPMSGYFYDKDDHRLMGSSIPLEVSPFEDKVGNLLSQYILTIRRNLNNVVFYNRDGLPDETIRHIEKISGRAYQSINFVPVSLSKLMDRGIDPRSLLMPVTFPMGSTIETINGIKMVIEIADRLLAFSAAESGTSLPREITATQDSTIKQNVATRRKFTLGLVDEAMAKKKRIFYEAAMEYIEDEVVAEVAIDKLGIDPAQAAVVLEELGFSIEAQWNKGGGIMVRGPKSKLTVDDFASGRDGINRTSDTAVAGQMLQMFQAVFSQPAIVERVGIETAIEWLNNIAIYAGLPTSMRLRVRPGEAMPQPDQLMAMVQQMMAQMGEQQMASIGQAIQKGALEPMRAEMAQALSSVADRLSRLEGAAGIHPDQQQPPAA